MLTAEREPLRVHRLRTNASSAHAPGAIDEGLNIRQPVEDPVRLHIRLSETLPTCTYSTCWHAPEGAALLLSV
jgi:hypothetical protein